MNPSPWFDELAGMFDDPEPTPMPRVSRRRKWGGRLDAYTLGLLIDSRSGAESIRWIRTWLKAGPARQQKMELKLYRQDQ